MAEFAVVYNNSYADTVTQNFKSFLDNDLYIDLVFVCRNNQKVGAHQIVMGCISKLFYSIFFENLNTAQEKVVHVYVPDIKARIMKHILEFIYCGKAMLNKAELKEFSEGIRLVGMPLDLFTPIEEGKQAGDISSANILNTSETNTTDFSTLSKRSVKEKISESRTGKFQTSVLNPRSASNEATVSSSNSSTIFGGTPPLVSEKSSSIISNISMVPGLPVITSVHALNPDTSLKFFEDTDSIDLTLSTNIIPASGVPTVVSTATRTSTDAAASLSKSTSVCKSKQKRKKSTDIVSTDQCINVDDSDDDSEIIMIS